MLRRYLMWFAHEHVDMRLAEMESIASMLGLRVRLVSAPEPTRPYWEVETDEASARALAARSVALRHCLELWSAAPDPARLHDNLRRALHNHTERWQDGACPARLLRPHCRPDASFNIRVETFGRHLSMEEKIAKIESFDYLPLRGAVSLRSPDTRLVLHELYSEYPDHDRGSETPVQLFFGRWIADGQRELLKRLSLKERVFIGNTSLDPQLSLLMCNQARVRPGDLVLDPFAGSGSLLVAAAHFGGYVWGGDIDFLMLHGRTRPTRVKQKVRHKEESIGSNMRQYGTHDRYLDVFVSDFSLPLIRDDMQFDAIVTDPPYGVREPTERIGINKANYTLKSEHLARHVPAKVDYALHHIYTDLLRFAAKHLVTGGRLVCCYPVYREEYSAANLPARPDLELVANCEQVLSSVMSRRVLVYEKSSAPAASDPAPPLRHDASDPAPPLRHDACFRDKYFASAGETRRDRRQRDMGSRYLAVKSSQST